MYCCIEILFVGFFSIDDFFFHYNHLPSFLVYYLFMMIVNYLWSSPSNMITVVVQYLFIPPSHDGLTINCP